MQYKKLISMKYLAQMESHGSYFPLAQLLSVASNKRIRGNASCLCIYIHSTPINCPDGTRSFSVLWSALGTLVAAL